LALKAPIIFFIARIKTVFITIVMSFLLSCEARSPVRFSVNKIWLEKSWSLPSVHINIVIVVVIIVVVIVIIVVIVIDVVIDINNDIENNKHEIQ